LILAWHIGNILDSKLTNKARRNSLPKPKDRAFPFSERRHHYKRALKDALNERTYRMRVCG